MSTQDGLYTTIIRGLNERGEAVSDARLIRSVNREISVYADYDAFLQLAHNPDMRFVFSNTTEAGISYHPCDRFEDAPAVSYPAKLTRLLYERYSHFAGAADKGWIIIPCELIDYNGESCASWCCAMLMNGRAGGIYYRLQEANAFCSTLVDRIVTGYPRDEAGLSKRSWVTKTVSSPPPNTSICLLSRDPNRWPLNCDWINCHLMS